MSVNAVGSGSGPAWAQMVQGVGGFNVREGMNQVLGSAANLLGMSTDDLRAQLASGQSLADVASSKGVSRDALLGAIKQALSSSSSQGSAPTGPALDALATRIADHKGGHHHHHHHHHVESGGSTSTTSPSAPSSVATPPANPATDVTGGGTVLL